MTEKNEAKFEEELTSHIKIDMRNLTNLNHAPKNLNILHFTGLLLTKVYNIWALKVQTSYVWWHQMLTQKLKENWQNLANFHRLKNSDSILENKMAKLN